MWSHLVFHRIITCVLFYRLDFSQSSASVLRSLILRGAKWLVLRNTVNYGQAHNGSPNIFSSNVMYFLPPVVHWLCVCARACVHACILTRGVFQVSTDVTFVILLYCEIIFVKYPKAWEDCSPSLYESLDYCLCIIHTSWYLSISMTRNLLIYFL